MGIDNQNDLQTISQIMNVLEKTKNIIVSNQPQQNETEINRPQRNMNISSSKKNNGAIQKKKITEKEIDNESNKVVVGALKFSTHMHQFSKLVSFIFIVLYSITWLVYLAISVKMYFDTSYFDVNILDFILQPTLVILGFYFGTKALENISTIVMNRIFKSKNENYDY